MSLSDLSHAKLAGLHRGAIAGQRAALALDDDALYAAACSVAKAYRVEIQRRTVACATQGERDALNAALRGLSIAEVEAERTDRLEGDIWQDRVREAREEADDARAERYGR